MPRMPLHPSSGGAQWESWMPKCIRLVRFGCTNRPFYHIVVMPRRLEQRKQPIEQLGTWDPCENERNEKLVAFNFERIQYWLGKGNVTISQPVEVLLGLAGFLPIHPNTYLTAWRKRRADDQAAAAAQAKDNGGEKEAAATT